LLVELLAAMRSDRAIEPTQMLGLLS